MVRRVVVLGVSITGVVLVTILVASPIISARYFDGDWMLVAALATAFAAYAPAHLARGICSGSGRFRAYAFVIGSDGVVRIAACIALAAAGVRTAAPYAFAVALAPLVAVVIVAARGELSTDDGPPADWPEVTQNLGWLLVGTVCAAALLNAGPVTATLLADGDQRDVVTQFGYGVLLARIPLFMFQAVQAALLPGLARLAARGQIDEFVSGFGRLMRLVGAVGVLGTAGAVVLGPWAIEIVYDATLSGDTLGMLALSSAIYMAALATAQAVVALRGHSLVAVGWLLGTIGFVVGTWLSSDDLFRRIEIGLVISSATALTWFALSLRHRLDLRTRPTADSALGAMTNMPLEG